MNTKKASLIIATYEMPRHLALVCAALERQSCSPEDYEIIFCDDGSGPESKAVIDDFKSRTGCSVHHVWQEHNGFRKCRTLNAAARLSQGEVLIFLDGDCVPHKDFVRDHLEQRESGRYLAGRRMELGPMISESLRPEGVREGFFDRPSWSLLKSVWSGESEHFQRSFRVTSSWLRSTLKLNHVDDLKGCNYSVNRDDLLSINGFDEEYEGYGREDTDAEIRLQHLGLKIKSLKGLALQFHVWHPRREFTPANDNRLDELKKSGRITCRKGIRDETA